MHNPSEKVFALLATVNESIAEINSSPISFGDTAGEARLLRRNRQLSNAINNLVDIPTTVGTHAFKAKAAACRNYYRQINFDDTGQLLDDVGLVGELVWSVLSDLCAV